MNRNKILIYGYGNPGRQDDALANELVDLIEAAKEKGEFRDIDTDSNYQLNIEDAELIARYDHVIFVDASEEDIEDVIITDVEPSDAKVEFTMHAVSPSFVLDLCIKMYNRRPVVQLLHIKGYEWEFMQPLTDAARNNLNKAFLLLQKMFQ